MSSSVNAQSVTVGFERVEEQILQIESSEVRGALSKLNRNMRFDLETAQKVCDLFSKVRETYLDKSLSCDEVSKAIKALPIELLTENKIRILEVASAMVELYAKENQKPLEAVLSKAKSQVCQLPTVESSSQKVLKKWRIEYEGCIREVSLLQNGKELSTETKIKEEFGSFVLEKKEVVDLLPFQGVRLSTAIQCLVDQMPYVEKDGLVRLLPVCKTWQVSSFMRSPRTVQLLWSPKNLVWNWFISGEPHQASQIPVSAESVGLSWVCSKEAIQAVREFILVSNNRSAEECADFFDDFDIPRINHFQMFLEPKLSCSSRLDPNIIISKFHWGVTLVSVGNLSNAFSHAQVIIEGIYNEKEAPPVNTLQGIKNGQYFCIMMDFDMGPQASGVKSCVRMSDFSAKEVRFTKRSQVWKIPSKSVRSMLDTAVEEMRTPSLLPDFWIFGRNGIYGKDTDANCFDWAVGKLQMLDIAFPIETSRFRIATATLLYTSLGQLKKQSADEGRFRSYSVMK